MFSKELLESKTNDEINMLVAEHLLHWTWMVYESDNVVYRSLIDRENNLNLWVGQEATISTRWLKNWATDLNHLADIVLAVSWSYRLTKNDVAFVDRIEEIIIQHRNKIARATCIAALLTL